jgi:hypothetical protein
MLLAWMRKALPDAVEQPDFLAFENCVEQKTGQICGNGIAQASLARHSHLAPRTKKASPRYEAYLCVGRQKICFVNGSCAIAEMQKQG